MPHLSYLTMKRNKETLPIFESPEARAISGHCREKENIFRLEIVTHRAKLQTAMKHIEYKKNIRNLSL